MKTSQSFPFYASDFLLGTALFSAAQVGAYIRLLCFQWQEGSLPKDENLLARLAQADCETITVVLGKFRECADGRLRNKRMENVRKSLNAYKKTRSENGSKGGRPKKHMVLRCFRGGKHTESLPSPSPSPSPLSPESVGESDWPARIVEQYPRRDSAMASMQAVADAIQGGEAPEAIRKAVMECASLIGSAPGGSSNRYVPTARAFFTGQQWRSPEKFKGLNGSKIPAEQSCV